MKVFWSWQSDTPAKNNHYFVRDALELALHKVAEDLNLDEAIRPEIDHDTKGEPGLVSIVDTIFQKIEQASVFVGDLTFVGKTVKDKLLPNPNVMIELGHAITSLGPERIILVANKAYGGKPEDLPFDLRHRRAPITYELREDAGTPERNKAKEALAQALATALSGCLGRVIQETAKEATFPAAEARPDDRSTWLPRGDAIEHHEYFHGSGIERWEVLEEPRFYMRVIPAHFAGNKTPREIHDLRAQNGLNLLAPWRDGNGGVNSLGAVSVGITSDQKAHAATQWFKNTSEIWAFNCLASFQQAENAPRLLCWGVFPKSWREHLDKTLALLDHIGVKGLLKVEAGVTGLKDVKWGNDFGHCYTALDDAVHVQHVDAQWDQKTRLQFLTDTFNRLGEAYNRPPVTVEQFLKIQ